MSKDRTFRNLAALQRTASTSRVLNLCAVEATESDDPDYRRKPFFHNKVLNGCVILKHRLRADESYVFDSFKQTATKIIIPFERSDLKLGGRSLFVGQRGWADTVREVCNETPEMNRDLDVLERLDELPSLDPFLLREHLKRRGHEIARCYFNISSADLSSMLTYAGQEIARLIDKAYPEGGSSNSQRLAEALLNSSTDERLEPLRLTLKLEGDAYREGVFCWKGFLFYKWSLASMMPGLKRVVDELPTLRATGNNDPAGVSYMNGARARLQRGIAAEQREVLASLKVYDEAFSQLTDNNPAAFRDFLLKAPELFLALGDKLGSISHIASFWNYRFPKGRPLTAPLDEACDILQEFESGLTVVQATAA